MKRENKRKRERILLIGLMAACILSFSRADAREKPIDTIILPGSFSSLAESVSPSVVNIRTEKKIKGAGGDFHYFDQKPFRQDDPFNEFFNRFFGNNPQFDHPQRSLGSGFIVDKEGYIVTNSHVVENADKIKVILKDGKEFEATIIGLDVKTDLALIKVEAKQNLPCLKLGSSANVKVGQWVVAIGSPFGLEQTVTAGIVSAKGRVIGSGPYDDFIQTDASINPGNSGGPLLDMDGEVVGINTAIIASGQGIGFAIPVDLAKGIIEQLKKHGTVSRGFLGVSIQNISKELAEYYNIDDGKGVLVVEVVPGGPADHAGIQAKDIILEINGRKVDNSRALSSLVAETDVGKKVAVLVLRGGSEIKLHVEIGRMNDDTSPEDSQGGKTEEDLGIEVSEFTDEVGEKYNLNESGGVIVLDVEPDSQAEEAGIMHGDIIKEINHHSVKTLKDFKTLISRIKSGEQIQFFIKRKNIGFIVVRMTR
ncbi:MAG: DegQ family serine endoprotease [Desulfobacteraceae bacterium]|nr:MAG: DegQ family serine endoprotease [Desulfobacteraceae bacterium]